MTLWDLLWGRQQETGIKPWQVQVKDRQGRVIFVGPRADLAGQDFRGVVLRFAALVDARRHALSVALASNCSAMRMWPEPSFVDFISFFTSWQRNRFLCSHL